jgi:chorismate dehydratase
LNTTPLVWGLLHGPQKGLLDLRFAIPSVCAGLLREGGVDIGLVPAIELERQAIEAVPPLGIVSRGEVRSILLISKVPAGRIATLAADESSRTSVVLARLILMSKYGCRPRVTESAPCVEKMLEGSDACLLIGDPALRWGRHGSAYHVYDLGAEWSGMTGLPMVYAVWAARRGVDWSAAAEILRGSWEYGRSRIAEIASVEAAARGVTEVAAREYLTRHIHFEVDEDCRNGLELFRRLARSAGLV